MGEFYDSSETCVSVAVQNAKQAFTDWKRLSAYERGKVLKKAANLIRVCDQKKNDYEWFVVMILTLCFIRPHIFRIDPDTSSFTQD